MNSMVELQLVHPVEAERTAPIPPEESNALICHTLVIAVPIYNEAEALPWLLPRLEAVASRIENAFPVRVSFIFIDDGSQDDSFGLLSGYDFGPRPVRLLRFSRNFGKEAALSAGIEAADYADAVVLIDADLQHPPEMVVPFVHVWLNEGVDSVYAYKKSRKTEGIFKAVLARLFYFTINRGQRYQIRENAGDFRLVNRRFMDALRAMPESQRFMKGLYGWVGFRQTGIPFEPCARTCGASSFSPLRLLSLTLDAVTSFSVSPLWMMAQAGFVIVLLSALYGLFIIGEYFFSDSVTDGFTSVLTLTAFFGGLQLMFLGILGGYVGKAVLEAKGRPAYIVADEIHLGGTNDAHRR